MYIYNKVSDVDATLAADCVEEFLDEGKPIEEFVPWMIEQGYDMTIFSSEKEGKSPA